MLLAIPLILAPLGPIQPLTAPVSLQVAPGISIQFVQNKPKPNFDLEVLQPLRESQIKTKADCDAQSGTLDGLKCVLPPPPTPVVVYTPPVAPAVSGDAKSFIYNHESGNVPCKINGGSINCAGHPYLACGLGQALPCSKLLVACPDLSDYACQDNWFTNNYMIPRYGTWENAVAFWLAHNWW